LIPSYCKASIGDTDIRRRAVTASISIRETDFVTRMAWCHRNISRAGNTGTAADTPSPAATEQILISEMVAVTRLVRCPRNSSKADSPNTMVKMTITNAARAAGTTPTRGVHRRALLLARFQYVRLARSAKFRRCANHSYKRRMLDVGHERTLHVINFGPPAASNIGCSVMVVVANFLNVKAVRVCHALTIVTPHMNFRSRYV